MADTLVRPSAAPPRDAVTAPRRARPAPWRPSLRGRVARLAVLGGLVAAVLGLPFVVPDAQVNIISRVVVFAIVALSLNLLVGYTGQVSLGHSAFLGVGAFSAAFLLTRFGLAQEFAVPTTSWLLAAAFAMAIGGLQALLLGGVALRISGLYLALVTLAYGLFAQRVLFNITALTGGGAGAQVGRPEFAANSDIIYAYVCFAALALVWIVDWRLTSSKAGRAIRALRDSEKVAASWGISVTRYKLLAFVLSGMVAGLAGALFASIETVISDATYDFVLSITFVFMVVVGGVGSRIGTVVGAAIFGSMTFVLDALAEAGRSPVDGTAAQVVGALLLLVVLVRFPGGIAQLLAPVIRWCSFRRWRATSQATGPGAHTGGADVRP